MAGLGHRLSNWLLALSLALRYGLTFVHDFEEAQGVHGDYGGWIRALGLGLGAGGGTQLEATWKGGVRERVESGELRQAVLPGVSSQDPRQTRSSFIYDHVWGSRVDSEGCGVVFRGGGDNWPYDFTSRVKAVVAAKWLSANGPGFGGTCTLQQQQQQQQQQPPGLAHFPRSLRWNSSRVIVAVHVRKGDVYSVPEDMLARMVSETVLPALFAEGFSPRDIAVHVFAEFRGYGREAFPTLAALGEGVGYEGVPFAAAGGGADGLEVVFWEGFTEWETFFHLVYSDFLVTSQSGFPSMASLFSLHTLALGFPSSNTLKHCRGDITCCYYDGRCSFSAVTRVRARARMLASGSRCGLLKARSACQ